MLWASAAISQVIQEDAEAKKKILFLTAERMLTKLQLSPANGQACELYLDILEKQGKFEEAITLLSSEASIFHSETSSGLDEKSTSLSEHIPYVVRLKCCTMLPVERLKRLALLHRQHGSPEEAICVYKVIIDKLDADEWDAYLGVIDLVVGTTNSGESRSRCITGRRTRCVL